MKASIIINLPIDKVVKLFLDKNYFKEWKKDFISYEKIKGNFDEAATVTRLNFKKGALIETIILYKLPDEIIMEYEHEKTKLIHTATNHFTSITDTITLYETELIVKKYLSIFMKIIMILFASAGKKYTQKQLNNFKLFAEKGFPN